MRLTASISTDEDGVFVAKCPSLPGCVSQGRTEAEAVANLSDAMRECLAVRVEQVDWSAWAAGQSAKDIAAVLGGTEDEVAAVLRLLTAGAAGLD
jgi:predicted RNase H-like HicB family nuclease